MTAGGPNEYGDDSPENRFKPGGDLGNEAYFVIVNKKTGKTEVWNEEFGQDRHVGTLDPKTGKFTPEPTAGLLGKGSRKNEAEYFTNNTQVITQQAQKVIIKEKKKEEGVDAITAGQEAQKLLGQDPAQIANQTTAVEGSVEVGKNTTTRAFVYPETLRQVGNAQDTIQITMIEYVPSGFDDSLAGVGTRGSIPGKAKERAETVILPIPGGIRAENNTEWTSNEMNALDAAKAQFITTTGNEGAETAIGGLKDKFDKANLGNVKTALLSALASGAGGANPVLARTSGQVFNPNMELLFKGPAIREFSFDFQFAPRNDSESRTVLQIIRFFKQGMAPIRSEGKLFLKTPNVFELKYTHKGGEHKGLNKFKECALTGCQVDYTPDGNYSTFEDGVMTSYKMTLGFKELEPIYSDDYGRKGSNIPAAIGF
tara:strand:- start:647 stop:1927 length:1281 start_codon:yes stop_codon:yes gene_type:complete